MFKNRMMATLRHIGLVLFAVICAVAILVGMYFVVSWAPKTSGHVIDIVLGVMAIFFGVMVVLAIGTGIWKYVNWQFIEPYKEWKNRGGQDDGKRD